MDEKRDRDATRSLEEEFAGPTFDLSGTHHRLVFWVLGTQDEYMGRRTIGRGQTHVDSLYCNEAPLAPVLRDAYTRLLREQSLADDLTESTARECGRQFASPMLASRIDRMYRDRRRSGTFVRADEGPGRMKGPRREVIDLRISREVFDGTGRESKVAYLAGAYARFGKNGAFSFANSEHKAALVAALLRDSGATDVRHDTDRGTIPNGNVVTFRASASLMRELQQAPRPRPLRPVQPALRSRPC